MDTATLCLIATGLLIAWIIIPLVVLDYRLRIVPLRYEEIITRFGSNNPSETMMSSEDRTRSGAWHYARLLNPTSEPVNPEEVIRRQFGRFQGWDRYWIPITLVILLSGIMLSFSGLWLTVILQPVKSSPPGGVGNTTGLNLLSQIPAPFVMALWGAYVWSLYEILSRKKSGDLTPVELYEIAFRYITAIPIGYAFSLLVFNTVPSLASFAVSALPLRDILRFFRQRNVMSNVVDTPQSTNASVFKGRLSETLFSVGSDTIARLEELNIETCLDLAYADPIKLLIKTGAPIEVVLSWIDQAMASVYAGPYKAILFAYGMPCALDLCEFFSQHCWDVARNDYRPAWRTDPAVVAFAAKIGIPDDFLVMQILRSIFEDPHTKFLIRVWYGPAQTDNAM